LATGSFGKEAVTLWDSATWQEVVTLEGPGRAPVAQLAFSPDGNCLLALSEDGLLHVWRAPSLTEIDAAEPRGTKQSEARPVARDR
jgi:WD40 repeat protein